MTTLAELAHIVDQYSTVRAQRLDADKAAASLKKVEMSIHAHIMDTLIAEGVGSVGGSRHRVTRQIKLRTNATSWPEVQAWIATTGNFQILQRRFNDKAIDEIEESGLIIPGTEKFETNKLSVSKL